QSGAHHAGDRTNVQFQPRRVRYRLDFTIENVIAVIRQKKASSLKIGNRTTAEFIQAALTEGQGGRGYFGRQFAARSPRWDQLLIADKDDESARRRGRDLLSDKRTTVAFDHVEVRINLVGAIHS